jgi:hypothetical protein
MDLKFNNFGVIITCSKNDYIFAKGCCASVRHFMGDVPICLLVDGVDCSEIAKVYNAQILTRADIQNPTLKEMSFGWGLTKMNAFWYSPFEHFMLLDADTAIWGDMLAGIDFDKYDVIIDAPKVPYTDEAIQSYFFDIPRLQQLYPDFKHKGLPYVCTGIIYAKKNALDMEQYINFLNMKEARKEIFKFGEQGYLNFTIFYAKQQGKIRVENRDIQYIVGDYPTDHMISRFKMVNDKPVVDDGGVIIHWAGASKPVISNPSGYYTAPMTFFRKKFLSDSQLNPSLIENKLKKEDALWRRKNPIQGSFWYIIKRLRHKLGI